MRLFLTITPCSASKNIILLKDKEYDPFLLQYIDIENIDVLRDTITKEYESKDEVDDNIHAELTKLTRVSKRELMYAILLYLSIHSITGR